MARTTSDLEREVVKAIRERRRAVRVGELDEGRELWRVTAFGRELPAVFDPGTGAVATFLPPRALTNQLRRRP